LVELPSQHRLMALAGGDAVDAYPWWCHPAYQTYMQKPECRRRAAGNSLSSAISK